MTCKGLLYKTEPLITIFYIRAALIELIWPFGGSRATCKHIINQILPYEVVMANVLANTHLFTHSAFTHGTLACLCSFGVVFLAIRGMYLAV